jgi:hypothetical protein
MKVLNPGNGALYWVSTLAAVTALSVVAGPIIRFQEVSPKISNVSYVDFAASSTVAGHQNFDRFVAGEHPRGQTVKYFEISVYADAQYAPLGRCYEISTSTPGGGSNPDTEILVKVPNNNVWQRLSDDVGPGILTSRARFWFGEDFVDPSPVFIRVAAYLSSTDTSHFYIQSGLVRGGNGNQPVLSEAECFSDANIAAAFVDRHEDVYIRRVH